MAFYSFLPFPKQGCDRIAESSLIDALGTVLGYVSAKAATTGRGSLGCTAPRVWSVS